MRRVLAVLVVAGALATPGASQASAAVPPPCHITSCPQVACIVCQRPIVGCWWFDYMLVCI